MLWITRLSLLTRWLNGLRRPFDSLNPCRTRRVRSNSNSCCGSSGRYWVPPVDGGQGPRIHLRCEGSALPHAQSGASHRGREFSCHINQFFKREEHLRFATGRDWALKFNLRRSTAEMLLITRLSLLTRWLKGLPRPFDSSNPCPTRRVRSNSNFCCGSSGWCWVPPAELGAKSPALTYGARAAHCPMRGVGIPQRVGIFLPYKPILQARGASPICHRQGLDDQIQPVSLNRRNVMDHSPFPPDSLAERLASALRLVESLPYAESPLEIQLLLRELRQVLGVSD